MRHALLVIVSLLFSSQLALAQPSTQQQKLVANNAIGAAVQGASVALSADGNTAIVGGPGDNSNTGAAWVWTRSSDIWTQQSKLVGTGAIGPIGPAQGQSVALSADGNTAIVGGNVDNAGAGAAWVWTRNNGVWTQQQKLVANDAVGRAFQGFSVALSADGNTAIVGGPSDNTSGPNLSVGAAWVWTRSNGVWTQQTKLIANNTLLGPEQGFSVTLSADGNTAIVGGPLDAGGAPGGAWIYTRSSGVWMQTNTLFPFDPHGRPQHGFSVALSADGNTAIVGGPFDLSPRNSSAGAAWVYTRLSFPPWNRPSW